MATNTDMDGSQEMQRSNGNKAPPSNEQSPPAKRTRLFCKSSLMCLQRDPNFDELHQAALADPAYRKAFEQLRDLLKSGEFDEKAFLANMASRNPETTDMINRYSENLLEKYPAAKEDYELTMKRIQEDPEYRSFAETSNPNTAWLRYISDKNLLLEAANRVRFKPKTNSAADDIHGPVHQAAMLGDVSGLKAAIESLNDLKLQLDLKDGQGMTALSLACTWGKVKCVKILIAAGADVNILGDNGNTPLHYAAMYGRVKCASLLLNNGANADLRNGDDLKPFDFAEFACQSDELLQLLRKHQTSD